MDANGTLLFYLAVAPFTIQCGCVLDRTAQKKVLTNFTLNTFKTSCRWLLLNH